MRHITVSEANYSILRINKNKSTLTTTFISQCKRNLFSETFHELHRCE